MIPAAPKAIFHLAGEQPLPVYLGIQQFDCPVHVIATTGQTRSVGEAVRATVTDAGRSIELLELDAYDLHANGDRIRDCLTKHAGSTWLFNLTGGTKPMFAAAYRVAHDNGIRCFYIETVGRTVDWLDAPAERDILKPSARDIRTFIQLAGYDVARAALPNPEFSPERIALLNECWTQRRKLQRWYRDMSRWNEYPGVPFSTGPRTLEGLPVSAQLEGPEYGYRGALTVGKVTIAASPWPELAKFICGGWYEQFVYLRMRRLLDQGKVTDVVMNLQVVAAQDENEDPFQEFDVAMTDGYRLTLLECKAGDVDQSHVQKLENLTQRFGGHFGKGVLVLARRDRVDSVRERVERSGNIALVLADAVAANPERVLNCRPGEIVTV